MAKKPEDRYPTCLQVVEDARRALGVSGDFPAVAVQSRRAISSRGLTFIAAAGALIAAIVVAVVAFGSGAPKSPPSAAPASRPHVVERIDVSTGRIRATIAVGAPLTFANTANPTERRPLERAIAVDSNGSAWITNAASNSVTRIDPVDDKATTIKLSSPPFGIAAGSGAIWVTSDTGLAVYRIDPATNRVTATVTGRPTAQAITADPQSGTVWFVDQARGVGIPVLERLDPQTNAVVHSTTLVSSIVYASVPVRGLAVGGGSVWATTPSGLVIRTDAATQRVENVIHVGNVLGDPAVDASTGTVWIPVLSSGGQVSYLQEIDMRTNKVGDRLNVGCCPASVAVGEGFVWVTDASKGEVTLISETTGDVIKSIRVGSNPSAIAVGHGTAWVVVDRSS
jgi:streptogramin lyase